MWRIISHVLIAFFPGRNKEMDSSKWKLKFKWTYCSRVNKSGLLVCSCILCSQANFFGLFFLNQCWSFWIRIPLYLGIIRKNIALSQLHLFQVKQVKTYVQNLISFRILLMYILSVLSNYARAQLKNNYPFGII